MTHAVKSGDDFEKPNGNGANIRERVVKFYGYLKNTDVDEENSIGRKTGIGSYRFFHLLYEKFLQTELPRSASALTYTSILSLFPLLAIISFTFSIFYTEQREQESLRWIQEQFLPTVDTGSLSYPLTESETELFSKQQHFTNEVQTLFSNVIAKFRENKTGVGAFGVVGLLVACGLLYYSIEQTVNQVWQAVHRNTWIRTFTIFVTLIALAPLIITLSITATGMAVTLLDKDAGENSARIQAIAPDSRERAAPMNELGLPTEDAKPHWYTKTVAKLRTITTIFGFLLPVIPVVANALMLALAYTFIPRTRVRFRYAMLGGTVASIFWEIARYVFFFYVYASVVNRTLADVLGISVIFLLWLYITWIILLAGNLIVYVSQNFSELWAEKMISEQTMLDARLIVAIMVVLARRFQSQGGGLNEYELRTRLGLPQESFLQLIQRLKHRGYVTPGGEESFQLARPADQITVRELLALGFDLGMLPIARRGSPSIRDVFHWIQTRSEDAAGEATLADLLSNSTTFFQKEVKCDPQPAPAES